MKKRTLMVCVILSILFLIAQLSNGGIIIDQRVKDNEGKTAQVILYCSENQLRTDHPESGLSTIMDLKADQIVLIDHRSKGYLSMKLSQWEKELAKRLKERRPQMRVVLMSGYPGGALLVLNYGWHYIEKPFVPAVLVSKIKDLFRTETREQSTDRFDTRKEPRRSFGHASLGFQPSASWQARRGA